VALGCEAAVLEVFVITIGTGNVRVAVSMIPIAYAVMMPAGNCSACTCDSQIHSCTPLLSTTGYEPVMKILGGWEIVFLMEPPEPCGVNGALSRQPPPANV
jgi:hypothetical protein